MDVNHDLQSQQQKEKLTQVSIFKIDPNPNQPRSEFDKDKIEELAHSIKKDGILQPLIVSEGSVPGRYTLIAGERRLRAAKKIGLTTVPIVFNSAKLEEDRLRIALVENIQRSQLNIIEEAKAYQALVENHNLSYDECAAHVGKDRSTVVNAIRLLSLPLSVRDDLVKGIMSPGHGKALLALKDARLILKAREIIQRQHLSVRKTEALCKSFIDNAMEEKRPIHGASADPNMEYIAHNLRTLLKTKVKLIGQPQKGKIEISYFSTAELERILNVLNNE